ncbi:MAG: hypothetical protein GX262_09170 [Clostridia bacterium]|jgi:hypothetical protein|nr:hypothetical protein [Clostridia bacterium]
MRKIIIAIILIMALVVGGAVFAQNESREESIKVVYQNIKLVINGRLVSTPVEPFSVEEGHLMVPVRAIGEALGCLVEWDPDAKVVYLNNEVTRDRQTAPQPIPVYVEQLPALRNVGPFFQLESRNITIASRAFNHGLVVELVEPKDEKKEDGLPGHYGEAVVELKGNYTWLEGYLGVDDETRNSWGNYQLQIFGDDILLYESQPVKPAQYPLKIRVNVEKIQRLTLVVNWLDAGLGDYDRLWAALADFQVY